MGSESADDQIQRYAQGGALEHNVMALGARAHVANLAAGCGAFDHLRAPLAQFTPAAVHITATETGQHHKLLRGLGLLEFNTLRRHVQRHG